MSFVLGTMNIEYPYSSNKEKTLNSYKEIIEKYISVSNNPIIDTAYYYGNTKTEIILGNILKEINKKITIATKANPWFNNDFTNNIFGQLSKENLERQLTISLRNLKIDKIDIFYLHCPDHETPIMETLEKCDELWRKEKYNHFGISNYSKNDLEEIINICDNNFNIKLEYYQGMYNIISRKVEEIFPLLDENNIHFWAYNPLAGGLLTGKYNNDMSNDSRFKDNDIYKNIFWKEEIINNLEEFFKLNNPIEKSFHWLLKYSMLRENDKIILGVSTLDQLNININIINKNLIYDNNIINKINNIYIKKNSPNYFY